MKFLALALDYDGTIAKDDRLDPKVREAIGYLRSKNIVVLIVTGRRLDDLRRVAGDLHFVDAVVAENGAVLEFTDSGYSRLLASPPPPRLLEELQRQNIQFAVGQSVLEANSEDAPKLLEILRRLELPLSLLFNRGRVMMLPQATSKATGLREALKILRLSAHNTVAIGDAENDHELLKASELGVAVGWGSPTLKAAADYVLGGVGPQCVAEYINGLTEQQRIPRSPKTRRRLMLGYTDTGKPLSLAVRGRTVLVAGDTKSGKSWAAGLLCEQMILYGYSLLIIDPEGDYISLESLPGVVVYGGADPLPRPRDLLRALRHADMSLVIDLSHTAHETKVAYVRNLLVGVAALRRHTGLPHRIILDEAHYFLNDFHEVGLFDLELGSYTLVTYRASSLHPEVLANAEAIIVTRESDPREIGSLRELCHSCDGAMDESKWSGMLGSLLIGEAALLPLTSEAEGEVCRVHLAPRLTPHVRHIAKYVDVPVPMSEQFVFWRDGAPSGQYARTLRQLVATMEQWPVSALHGHLLRSDFSRWIANVFGDYPLANTVQELEGEYRQRRQPNIVLDIIAAIRSRYDFIDPLAEHHAHQEPRLAVSLGAAESESSIVS